LSVGLFLWIAPVVHADPIGLVRTISQERVIQVPLTAQGTRIETGLGAFADERSSFSVAPPGFVISAHADQASMIASMPDGTLEIRATGGVVASSNFGARPVATSKLTSRFLVEGVVPYVLEADTAIFAAITLSNEFGPIDVGDLGDHRPTRGLLGAGTYTLVVEATGGMGGFDVRFTAGARPIAGPRCMIDMSRPSYGAGSVVTASLMLVQNPTAAAVPVEVKMWLRRPDGLIVPARNDGAAGDVSVPGAISHNFGPLAVMGVDAESVAGIWEFGCRLLNPETGEQLDEDSDLFEIR
jgi:hypothetical protein